MIHLFVVFCLNNENIAGILHISTCLVDEAQMYYRMIEVVLRYLNQRCDQIASYASYYLHLTGNCYNYSSKGSQRIQGNHNHRTSKTNRYYIRGNKKRGSRIAIRRSHFRLTSILGFSTVVKSQSKDSIPTRKLFFDSDSFNIKIDNCASRCITNDMQDVVGMPRPSNVRIKGFGGYIGCTFEVTIKWSIEDDLGRTHTFLIPGSFYSKQAPSRLFSPQHWAQTQQDKSTDNQGYLCITYHDKIILKWNQEHERTIPLDGSTNVGILRSSPGFRHYEAFCTETEAKKGNIISYSTILTDDERSCTSYRTLTNFEGDALTKDEGAHNYQVLKGDVDNSTTTIRNVPLTTDFNVADKTGFAPNVITDEEDTKYKHSDGTSQMLHWHHRLNHLPFKKIRRMAHEGLLPKIFQNCRIPMCTACLFGKATRRPWRLKGSQNLLRLATAKAPGECVSVDQLESTTPGFVAQLKGKLTTARYRCATVFVDHYSGISYVQLQQSTNANETLTAKLAFETFCRRYGVTVKRYHTDNGRFAENVWKANCNSQRQTLTHCGVNAHWQNGIAEKRIRDLQDQARTMIIHAHSRWPAAISHHLWPYAIRMACEIHRDMPSIKDGIPPMEKFTKCKINTKTNQAHPFGSPVYSLDVNLQSGKKIPKWNTRSNLGLYLGTSPQHAKSVSLVLNLRTGHVSPQYHLVHDNHFETVRKGLADDELSSRWKVISNLDNLPINKREMINWKIRKSRIDNQNNINSSSEKQTQQPVTLTGMPDEHSNDVNPPDDQSEPLTGINVDPSEDLSQSNDPAVNVIEENEELATRMPLRRSARIRNQQGDTSMTTSLRRSTRTRKSPERYMEVSVAELSHIPNYTNVANEALGQDQNERYCEFLNNDPIAFSASNDPDVLRLNDAMKAPDANKFIMAMKEEFNSHVDNDHWDIIQREEVPRGFKVLPAVWSMKRKRRMLTREVYKWKSRLNVGGHKQEIGINYWETYAPVVAWASIRLLLIISMLAKWHTVQVDFVMAYPQADIETDMYMDMPKGFAVDGNNASHVLRLKKNLYGQKQAGRVWYKHLSSGLIKLNYQQSKVDECVFYKGPNVFLFYVDDGIFLGPDRKAIDILIAELKEKGKFDITVEGDLGEYLGVKRTVQTDGSITLTQPHLIESILNDLNLNARTKSKDTPAQPTKILHQDAHGINHDPKRFDYRSVIGKLNFLEKSTRPDIAYAVHQCARFSIDPKECHSNAVMRIGRYLHGTRDRGITMKPTQHCFDCWVDADYSGTWNKDICEEDATTAKSRSGYVIRYAGCPIIWGSRMQTTIALSTTEAEYNALSMACREVIYIQQLMEDMKRNGIPIQEMIPSIHCKLFEDNMGACELAKVPKMRARTKHINIKYHHFREWVTQNKISIHVISTTNQLADIFTKPLSTDLFTKFRKSILMW